MTFGFFHIGLLGHWEEVNKELLIAMFESKLLDNMELFIIYVGENGKLKLPFKHDSFTIGYGGDLLKYEYATQKVLKGFCETIPGKYSILYLCNAGVSHPPNHDLYPEWRHLMTHFTIHHWKDCIKHLDEYDTVGIEWQTDPVSHWSGNFWWATSEYIRTLPYVEEMQTFDAGSGISHKTHPRHGAEWWIGMNPECKHKSLFQTGYNWRDRPRKDWLKEIK